MKYSVLFFTLVFISLLAIHSCKPDVNPVLTDMEIVQQFVNLPEQPYNYTHQPLPAFYKDQFVTIQDNEPVDNPASDWGATLGRVLFYDTRLSANKTISCSNCHKQEFGFTDTALLSKGFHNGNTGRHSMAIANARFYLNGRFFWDERAATLEDQVLMPIQDKIEMGMSLDSVVSRLNATSFYPILFEKAFGTATISSDRISKALAQFIRSIVSYRSKYDKGRQMVADRDLDFPNFTVEENEGKKLFITDIKVNCFGCHNTDAFITDNPRNNGLSTTNSDQGIYVHTGDPLDIGKFKAPSLKNVALRKHYMHDGSLTGLDAVLKHYNEEIKYSSTLDPHLVNNGQAIQKNLNPAQLKSLKAFLETLTDEELIKDEKFSDPFRR